ncbi:hypothetical protein D3C73_979910 [compost metagenome]
MFLFFKVYKAVCLPSISFLNESATSLTTPAESFFKLSADEAFLVPDWQETIPIAATTARPVNDFNFIEMNIWFSVSIKFLNIGISLNFTNKTI